MLVCDLTALNPNRRHEKTLNQLKDEGQEECERAEREFGKYLRKLLIRNKVFLQQTAEESRLRPERQRSSRESA